MKNFSTSIALIIVLILVLVGALSASGKTKELPQRSLKEHTYYVKKNASVFDVKYAGVITISENDKDIKSISPNGYLKIEQSSFGNKRKLEIVADSKGNLSRKYFEGKKEESFADEGKDWLESLMPELIVKTGIGAQERAIRIYKQKGMRAALDEAEDVKNGGGTSTSINIGGFYNTYISISNNNAYTYYKVLLKEVKMNNDELEQFIEALAKVRSNSTKGSMLRYILNNYELNSVLMEEFLETVATQDYNTERGNTLRAFQQKYPIDKSNYREYFDVIDGMSINSEKGNVLKPLLQSQKLDPAVFNALMQSVRRFSNHSERGAVLRVASQYIPDDAECRKEFEFAVESMSSAYRYLQKELMLLMDNPEYLSSNKVDKNYIINTLKEVKYEQANTKKTTTMRKFHSSMPNDPKVIETYFNVIESMDNNMEVYSVLLDLLYAKKLDKVAYLALYYVAEELAEDDYKHGATALIRESLKNIPNDKEVLDQLFDAVDEIDHASGREEMIRLMVKNDVFKSNMAILKMLRIAGDIDVDIEKAIALNHIYEIMPKNNEEITYLYKRLADEIEDEFEYNRALSIMKN